MSPAKFKNNPKKDVGGGDNEILGIALVIISAFILICIVITPLMGDVSKAIKNVVLGLFGFSSYAIFLSTLVVGVALIQNKRITLAAKYIICLAAMVFCAMMILQLATTHNLLKESFADYISKVFSTKTNVSAGGILFGVLAYGLQAAITPVFSYIILSIGLVFAFFFFSDIFIKYKKRTTNKAKELEQPKYKFEKGLSQNARPVKPITDNSLYVGTIVHSEPKFQSVSGSFGDIVKEIPQKPMNISDTPLGHTIDSQSKTTEFLSYDSAKQEKNQNYKSEAHKILFGNTYDLYQKNNLDISAPSRQNRDNLLNPSIIPTLPPIATTEPEIKSVKKPPKIVHANVLQEVVVPAPKDFSDQIVGGTIINGDEYSRTYAESELQKKEEIYLKEQSEAQKNQNVNTPKNTFDVRKIEPISLKPIKIETPKHQAPISTGAYNSVINNFEPFKNSIDNEPIIYKPEDEPQFPIMNGDYFADKANEPIDEPEDNFLEFETENNSAESRLEKLMNEEKNKKDYSSSSFNIVEDVEDLSEKGFKNDNDHTGYYNIIDKADSKTQRERFEERIKNIENEIVPIKSVNATNNNHTVSLIDSKARNKQMNIDEYNKTQQKQIKKKFVRYTPPPLELLVDASINPNDLNEDCEEKARLLENTLESLKLPAKVSAITRGPAVTRYELEMPPGISVKRIEQYTQDIAYNLACNGSIRIETPIPGKRAVGIEIPNESIATVGLKEIINSNEFRKAASPLTVALGKDIAGSIIVCDLIKMPHLLIAGSTGSGKSACLSSIITSFIYKSSPDDVRLILIDPKRVEFSIYKDLPHLMIKNIITEPEQALNAFNWAIEEMERRYTLFGSYIVRNLQDFNNSQAVKDGIENKIPSIVIIVDELSNLMSTNKKDVEDRIRRLAEKSRAAGIHLIIATQRPSVDVITGTIKTNLPSRIAFAVTNIPDSRTILDQSGAESLLGRGDMLFAPQGVNEPRRVQGAYITNEEVASVVNFVKEHNQFDYDEAVENAIMIKKEDLLDTNSEDEQDEFDSLLPDVVRRVIESGQASTSMIQRRFSVGYARASRIIDQMELRKFIGALDGSKPREVYISREQFKEIFGEDV